MKNIIYLIFIVLYGCTLSVETDIDKKIDSANTKTKLPNDEFIDKCKGLDFHAVIDLNPEFNPIAMMLIKNIKSNIKIGYYSKYAEKYYYLLP